MPRILLAGQDWRVRALLRAQLIEEGFDVEAHESVASALDGLNGATTLPALFIADVSEGADPLGDVDQLAAWVKLLPVWLLAARSLLGECEGIRERFERVLVRPLDLGALVAQIKRRLSNP